MADPIFWCNNDVARAARQMRAGTFNPETGVREPSFDPLTRLPRMERVPQRAHDGDSDPKKPTFAGIPRWMHVLRHDGHEVRVPITTSAAPIEDSRYGLWMQMKARELGWIPIGQCPPALLVAGLIKPHHLVDQSLVDEPPCPRGEHGERRACKHYLAEQKARRTLRARVQARRDRETESAESKMLKVQQATADGILELGRALMSRNEQAPTGKQKSEK
ncbi:MAG TPA: hypothetical protein VK607_10700 [Kofleriaceae bacterium]|nr:hypothetical protein [Kofleriaceae bacterium]